MFQTAANPGISMENEQTNKQAESLKDLNPEQKSDEAAKPKKSRSLLSTLVRRRISKTKKTDKKLAEIQNQTAVKVRFISSISTIGSHSTEQLCPFDEASLRTDADSLAPSANVKRSFFGKLLKKRDRKKSRNVHTIESRHNIDDVLSQIKVEEEANPPFVPISFIEQDKLSLPKSMFQGLVAVQNLAYRLQQSEGHFLKIFVKYISDVSFQKELADALCSHSHLHMETERMNNILSMEMLLKQVELEKTRQTTLQDAFDSAIRHNRHIQVEYDMLFCSYEKSLRKIKCNGPKDVKSSEGNEAQIQEIIKHNVSLTNKTEALYKQIEGLEKKLADFQEKNDGLENQLSEYIVLYNDHEARYHRTKVDYELEIATLNHQLKSKEKALFKALNVYNKFKHDLLRNKELLLVNVDVLPCDEDKLDETIEFIKNYIGELVKELFNLKGNLLLKENEIKELSQANEKLLENAKQSTCDLEEFKKKIQESEKLLTEHRYKCFEAEMKIQEEKFERNKLQSEMEKSGYLRTIAQLENSDNEKTATIEELNGRLKKLNAEMESLKNRLEKLGENESGDISKELKMNREKLIDLDMQCIELNNEKRALLLQLEEFREDNKKFSEFQMANNQHIEQLHCEMEKMMKEHQHLKQKHDVEKQTVLSLQFERKKYLEEKSLIKTLFNHMKHEISRLQHLEGSVVDMSKEASKLALIADYNKQLGKKLKAELDEKVKTITNLRVNVEKLDDIRKENAEEKLHLYRELADLCQIKDRLCSELNWEKRETVEANRAKTNCTNSTQIPQHDDFHKEEKAILKNLLKDLKYVVKQRNSLISERDLLTKELSALNKTIEGYCEQQKQSENQSKRIDELTATINEQLVTIDKQNQRICRMEGERKSVEDKLRIIEDCVGKDRLKINTLQGKLSAELETYDDNVRMLEEEIARLKMDKMNFEDSIKYLQNNTQKLFNDLNNSRACEKDLRDALAASQSEKIHLEEILRSREKLTESIESERDKLQNEMDRINSICDDLLSGFETNMNRCFKKDKLLMSELHQSQKALLNVSNEKDQLNKELTHIKEDFKAVNRNFFNLIEQEQKWVTLVKAFEEKRETIRSVIEDKEKLLMDNEAIKEECKMVKDKLLVAKEECESLIGELSAIKEERNGRIDEIVRSNDLKTVEINSLKSNIEKLNEILDNERSSYKSLSQVNKEISSKFMKSVKDAAEEKNARLEAERKLREYEDYINKLRIKNEELEDKVNDLTKKIEENNEIIEQLEEENNQLNDIKRNVKDKTTQVQTFNEDIEELKYLQSEIERMKLNEIESHKAIMALQDQLGLLHKENTNLAFEKSAATLKLHEFQKKFETEQHISKQLQNVQKYMLDGILKMKDDGSLGSEQYDCLITYIKNDTDADDHRDGRHII